MAAVVEPLSQPDLSFQFEAATGEPDDGLSTFVNLRPRLLGIAYRVLKSRADADDVVQEVWLRWQSADRSRVENPSAFLVTTTTRLCINLAQSARSRRETCIGTWFPEPVDPGCDPGLRVERGQALKMATIVLLEKLSPVERAAFVLREAFDYAYGRIATILKTNEPNVRQLVSRARRHLANGRCLPVSSGEQRRLLETFIAAAQNEEMAGLEDLLTESKFSYSGSMRCCAERSSLSIAA